MGSKGWPGTLIELSRDVGDALAVSAGEVIGAIVELDNGALAFVAMDCGAGMAEVGAYPFQSEALDMAGAMRNLDGFTGQPQANHGWMA